MIVGIGIGDRDIVLTRSAIEFRDEKAFVTNLDACISARPPAFGAAAQEAAEILRVEFLERRKLPQR